METALKSDNTRADAIKVLGVFLVAWIVGTFFYHTVEDLSFVNAVYFAAMTLTTVGYGDFTPTTDASKIFTIFYAFVGVGIFFGFASIIFNGALQRSARTRMTLQNFQQKFGHRDSQPTNKKD